MSRASSVSQKLSKVSVSSSSSLEKRERSVENRMPQTTEAIAPEKSHSSQMTYESETANRLTKILSILFLLKRNIKKQSAVTAIPTATAPMISLNMTLKNPPDDEAVTIPEKQTNSATPTPSLKRDSPSIKNEILFGKPNLLRIPVAAIGSVGATMLPNIRQTGSESPAPNRVDAP